MEGMCNAEGDRIPSDQELRASYSKSAHQVLVEERGNSPVGRTTYKFCQEHSRVEKLTSRCFTHMQERNPKATDLEMPNVTPFREYWDPHLGKGQPVLVKSWAHRRRLMKQNGLQEI